MQDHKLFSFICYILLIMPCGWSSNSSKLNPIEQIWCELNCHVWCRTLKSYHSDKPCRSGTTFIRLQSWCQWDVIYNLLKIPMVDTRVIDFLLTFFDLGLWSCDFVILAFVLLHCLMALCQHMFWFVKYLLFWYFWSNMKCIIDIEKSVYPFLCPLWKESLYSDKTIALVYLCFFAFFVFFN